MARFLVTAGPTIEAIDPVRFLSNRSSGKMGYAICDALITAGHEVVLVSGPTVLQPPHGVQIVAVESALEMLEACIEAFEKCDGLFAVAAVSDYRPAEFSSQKVKRDAGDKIIRLTPNPDIVKTLAAEKKQRLVVGFALESERGEQYARQKMIDKNLDFVCLNSPSAQGADESQLQVISNTLSEQIGPSSKSMLATQLVGFILKNSDV